MDVGAHLIDALRLVPRAHVAFVGGGGKSTLTFGLVAAARTKGWRSLAGTTTKVGRAQVADPSDFLCSRVGDDKIVGVSAAEADARFAVGDLDVLSIEADGSRSKVVKAPREGEPVIGATATHVVAVIGADGLDRVIEDVAHRPMLVAAVCGCGPYERLTVERAARLLASERGGRKAVPPGALFAVAVTRIGPRQEALAARLTAHLTDLGIPSIAFPILEGRVR